jgi:hypothetical protein
VAFRPERNATEGIPYRISAGGNVTLDFPLNAAARFAFGFKKRTNRLSVFRELAPFFACTAEQAGNYRRFLRWFFGVRGSAAE